MGEEGAVKEDLEWRRVVLEAVGREKLKDLLEFRRELLGQARVCPERLSERL